jgi:acetoacetate decarboxylase
VPAYRRLPAGEGEAMPAHRPMYPALPAYYREAEFQIVYFRCEPAVVQEHLPAPLEADPEGLAAAFSLRAPACSAYGPYREVGIRLRCAFRGVVGFYSSHQYNDNVAAICAGRERWGGPKEYAAVEIERRGNVICAQAVKEGAAILTLTTTIERPAEAAELIPMTPSYRLKLIPRADGPGAAIKQIITYAGADVECAALFAGAGRVTLGRTASSDLAALQSGETLGAYYQVLSLTEGYGEIVYDYLEEKAT